MNKEERINRVNKVEELLLEAPELINGIIYESEEGQPDHFNKLTKLEQIKIVSCRALLASSFIQIHGLQDTLSNLGGL